MTGAAPAGASAGGPLVRFESVRKTFGDVAAVDGVTLDINDGEFFALLGPSGCGKTTLLRMLAGFETPSAGRVLLDGRDIAGVPPHRRAVNMMFQSYALFPHLTVEGNVAFGLKQEGLSAAEIRARVADMLALVRLDGLGGRRPHQLSGGQRQRVALARALVKRPRVFLLDEPLAALDRKLREETRFELKELQKRLRLTFVIVTHDQDEAMMLADRIAVMNQGRLVQVGSPAEVYERPTSRWVAAFIGDVNLLEGRLVSTGPGGSVVETAAGKVESAQAVDAAAGATVWVAVRPEAMRIVHEAPPSGRNGFSGRVQDVGYLGDMTIYKVAVDDGLTLRAALANRGGPDGRRIAAGDRVALEFAPEAAVVLTR